MTPAELRSRARSSILTEAERVLGPLASWSPDVVMAFSRVEGLRDHRVVSAVAFLLAQTEARGLSHGERRRQAFLSSKEAREGLTEAEHQEAMDLAQRESGK